MKQSPRYNHRGCSEGYDLHKFDPLKAVNSEVCEQKNSGFVMLRYDWLLVGNIFSSVTLLKDVFLVKRTYTVLNART